MLILQKSIKSLQLVLNEFFKKLDNGTSVTKSAFTQARRHLSPDAFVTLNQKAVRDVFYDKDGFLKVWGSSLRDLLAIDGSKIHLPESSETK